MYGCAERSFQQYDQQNEKKNVISRSASICIITFNHFADCYSEFTDLERISSGFARNLETEEDATHVSCGIDMALDRLDRFQARNREAGNDSYRPVLIFMSDGKPTDGAEADMAQKEVRQRSEDRNLNVIPVAFGKGIKETWLRGLSRESRISYEQRQ